MNTDIKKIIREVKNKENITQGELIINEHLHLFR